MLVRVCPERLALPECVPQEGLTMYRDREFTSDLNSRAVKRIDDVTLIRSAQVRQQLD